MYLTVIHKAQSSQSHMKRWKDLDNHISKLCILLKLLQSDTSLDLFSRELDFLWLFRFALAQTFPYGTLQHSRG